MKFTTYLFLLLTFSIVIHAQTWHKIGFTSTITNGAFVPTIAFDTSGNLYSSFCSFWDDKAAVIKNDGTSWNMVGSIGISAGDPSNCGSGYPISIAPNGTPYIAYPDTNAKVTVKKFDGTNWVNVGSAGFSSGPISSVVMAIDTQGIPYVCFNNTDSINNGLSVMKFDGAHWVLVGLAGFSDGYANFPSITLSTTGVLYVAYGDFNHSGKVTVKKFNGTDWVNVGSADFSLGFSLYTSLAIDKNGTPYVAYQDQGLLSSSCVVMKFVDTAWVTVGTAGFSGGEASYTNIVIDTLGTPYVSFADYANGQKATVMQFNGTNWVSVGTPGLSDGAISYNSLALDKNGRPYLSYTDTGNGNATVMKFETTSSTNLLNNTNNQLMAVLPNPNNGSFTLKFSNLIQQYFNITITNISGEVIKEFIYTENTDYKIGLDVPKGLYFINTSSKFGKTITTFIIY